MKTRIRLLGTCRGTVHAAYMSSECRSARADISNASLVSDSWMSGQWRLRLVSVLKLIEYLFHLFQEFLLNFYVNDVFFSCIFCTLCRRLCSAWKMSACSKKGFFRVLYFINVNVQNSLLNFVMMNIGYGMYLSGCP